MTPYPYQPLNLPRETRILTIFPGKREDALTCSLSHLDIQCGDAYDALSYCWSKSITSLADALDADAEITMTDDADSGLEARQLKVRELLSDPQYRYLYVLLGATLPEGSIFCDGLEMTVGGELFSALEWMRDETETRRLWVDALCINQNDMQERNEHVKVMGSIYANASVVRVWLGNEIGVEEDAFRALKELDKLLTDIWDDLKDASFAETPAIFQSHPQWYTIEWDAVAKFLGRAWFERIWVVQEIANAKEAIVYSGGFSVPWNFLSNILSALQSYKQSNLIENPPAVKSVCTKAHLRRRKLGGSFAADILDLLEGTRDLRSTFASDKVYGILGLVDGAAMVEVDYAKRPEDVFTDLAVHYLRGGLLHVLCYCVESSAPAMLKLPSWVPDWTRPGYVEPLLTRGLGCKAAGDTSPQCEIDVQAGEIRLQGRLLDTVRVVDEKAKIPLTTVLPDWRNMSDTDPRARTNDKYRREQRNIHESWENMLRLAWPTPEDFTWAKHEALWRTFMCNRTRENEVPQGDNYGPAWERLLEWMHSHTLDADGEDEEMPYIRTVVPQTMSSILGELLGHFGRDGMLDMVRGAHMKWCYHRRFFVSEAERYGWAADGALPGDIIVAFYGCDYPFLLHGVHGGYRIVSDCYIHGLMDGECLETEDFEEREFLIL